ncbi:MAG: hypothetical protein IPN11_15345 [Opitutaceae bacterium]|nr:hypothetical protein [Opitutaceae bacterium]
MKANTRKAILAVMEGDDTITEPERAAIVETIEGRVPAATRCTKILSASAAARAIGMSRRWFYNVREAEEHLPPETQTFPRVPIGPERYGYHEEDVLAFARRGIKTAIGMEKSANLKKEDFS